MFNLPLIASEIATYECQIQYDQITEAEKIIV